MPTEFDALEVSMPQDSQGRSFNGPGGLVFSGFEDPTDPDYPTSRTGMAAVVVVDSTKAEILGSKTDDKNAATNTTSISFMSVLKQISASIQAAAASLAGSLTVATHAVTQSGTWTVQPGNMANTTAWKVDGSAVTNPVSIADGSAVTLGSKADDKSTATNTTAISIVSILKQISASIQAAEASLAGTLTVATHAVTQSGTWTVQTTIGATTTTNIASTSADGAVLSATSNQRLMGFSFRENAGSTASFILRHGTDTSGTPLVYVTLAANESIRDWFGPNGKIASSGVYLDMISGTIIGQVDSLVLA